MNIPSSVILRCTFACMMLSTAAPARDARATPIAYSDIQEFQLQGDSGTIHIALHPDIVTILYLPAAILNVILSDTESFAVQADDERIVIRPSVDIDPGMVANIHVACEGVKLSIFLTIAPSAKGATSHMVVRLPPATPPPEPKPSLASRLSLSVGGIFGLAFPELPRTATRSGASPLAGIEAHLSLPMGRSYSLDAALTVAHTILGFVMDTEDALRPHQITPDNLPPLYSFTHRLLLTRLDLGATWRWRTRPMPFVYARSGMQTRFPIQTRKDMGTYDAPAVVVDGNASWDMDMLIAAGAGMEMAFMRDWAGGIHLSATRSILSTGEGFVSVEGSLFLRWR